MNKPRTFSELASSAALGGVEHLLKRSQRLKQVDALLAKMLDAELRPHCRVANIKGQTLILHVSSTAWSTRLRYQLPRLLASIREVPALQQISDIQLRVQNITPAAAPKRAPRQVSMSRQAAHCIETCAESVEDTQLRAALQRLARRGSDKTR